MKYSDQQRMEKIRETTKKLLDYVQRRALPPSGFARRSPSNGR